MASDKWHRAKCVSGNLLIAVTFIFEGAVGELAKGAEEAGGGIDLGEALVFCGGRIEGQQEGSNLRDGQAEGAFIEVVAVFLLDELGAEAELEADFVEPGLLVGPVLKAAARPAGEVVRVEA